MDFKRQPARGCRRGRAHQLRINRLEHPGLSHIGRPGLVEGTRELVVPPYIIVYELNEGEGEIIILAVMHGARDRS